MPLYEVWHSQGLSAEQQTSLSAALTKIHHERFGVPSPFVNVVYVDLASSQVYVGGHLRKFNLIKSYTREGHTDKQQLEDHVKDITAAWNKIVGSTGDLELHAVTILGSISAASEYGLSTPDVGAGSSWMKLHMPDFEQRAKDGNQAFQDMLSPQAQ